MGDGDDFTELRSGKELSMDEVEVPQVGMSFRTEQEVYSYYKKYASSVGFAIRRSNTKVGEDRKLKYFSLACNRSRKPTSTSKKFRLNSSIRIDCKAKINIVIDNDGRLILSKVRIDHNHALSPGKAQQTRESKKLGAQAIERRSEGNEPDNSNYDGRDNIDYIKNLRYLKLIGGDAEALQSFFLRMKKNEADFFYAMDFNEEGRLRNVFWADARMRATYEVFGDVVMLDTTYMIEKYGLPFVSFIGVNHHGDSVLLGCSLLSSDDTETYVWLFKTWLSCMSSCSPKAIITDQCKAVQGAASKVFPDARHRLCLWHIRKTIPEKLGSLAQYHAIKKCLKCSIYESLKREEFEESWGKMVEEYDLASNEWLKSLYADRHNWAPVFVKDTFWAGMSVIQRSDDMSAFFEGFINSRTSLKQFLEQFDDALRSKVENERKADYASLHTSMPLVSDLYIEKQFKEAYTHEIFKSFQEELKGLLYCNTSFMKAIESISTYEVTDSVKVKGDRSRKEVLFNVLFNELECEIHCSCHLFEYKGVLCRHAVSVLMKRNVNEIPSRYILSRWKKDIRRRYTLVKCSYDDFNSNPKMQRYERLCSCFKEIAEIASESQEKYKFLMCSLNQLKQKLLNNELVNVDTQPIQGSPTIPNPANWFISPLQIRNIGPSPVIQKDTIAEETSTKKKRKANSAQSRADINSVVVGNHQQLVQNRISVYPHQLNEVAHAQYGNTRWHYITTGDAIQRGLVSNSTGDGGFVTGLAVVSADVVRNSTGLGTTQNPSDDSTTL